MKPPRSILDRAFKYVPARLTDVAATIRRVQREQRANQEQASRVVRTLKRKT